MATLDLTKKKKEKFNLTLPDGTLIHVNGPSKHVMKMLGITIPNAFKHLTGIETDEDTEEALKAMDVIYDAVAEALSNNTEKHLITGEFLSAVVDLDDLMEIFNAYTDTFNQHFQTTESEIKKK